MQRTVSKPSLTWLLLVALLVTSGVLTAVRGLGDARNVAACSGYGYGYGYGYDAPAPVLTLALSQRVAIARSRIEATGVLTQNGCTLSNVTVEIRRRAVVQGYGSGVWTTLNTGTTDSSGMYNIPFIRSHNSSIQAFAIGAAGRPTVASGKVLLRLTHNISVGATDGSHIYKARICGRVKPGAPFARAKLYRKLNGVYHIQAYARVGTDNTYCFGAIPLPKGPSYVKVWVATTRVNLFVEKSRYIRRT